MLISAKGHVLTVWSYVLDADEVTVVLDDGRRFTAQHVAADPLTEIAVLKFDPGDDEVPHFDLSAAATAEPGARVLAFSNLFGIAAGDEPVSMLHGVVSAVAPLEARRGAFATNYRGDVYVVDAAANNPGAAGGALTDSQGRLLGMLGKELRSNLTGTWLNYALPVAAFAPTVDDILAGRFTPAELTEVDRPANPLSLAGAGHRARARRRHPHAALRRPRHSQFAGRHRRPSARRSGRDDRFAGGQLLPPGRPPRSNGSNTTRRSALAVLRDEQFLEFTLTAKPNETAAERRRRSKRAADENCKMQMCNAKCKVTALPHFAFCILHFAICNCFFRASRKTSAASLAAREEAALKAAAESVAPSVVQIRTIGGLDVGRRHAARRRPDHRPGDFGRRLHLSSAFNFVQQPASILVTFASGKQAPAELVATDHSRMLVLLKANGVADLPVPELCAGSTKFAPANGRSPSAARFAPIARTFRSASSARSAACSAK